MSLFFTSDWHLGETRLYDLERPILDPGRMIEYLIRRHNEMVRPDDTVVVVGDVCHREAPELVHLVARFNGRKVLVRGNHDRPLSDPDLSPYFEAVVPDGDGLEMDVGGVECWVTHYPTRGRHDRFNLVGHIHGTWRSQLNMLNVGVDAHHFRPVPAERVPFYLERIRDFYDDDGVRVAYSELNAAYLGRRGRSGTYFPPSREERDH